MVIQFLQISTLSNPFKLQIEPFIPSLNCSSLDMIEPEELDLWFSIVKTSQFRQIETFLEERPHCVQMKLQPLGQTAVFVAIKYREDTECKKIIEILRQKGAELNLVNKMGQNPLFYAVSHNKPHTCRYLMKSKVDPSIQDDFGQTAKEYASSLGRSELVSILEKGEKGVNKRPLLYEPRQETAIDTQYIPKLTYRLCKLTREGRVQNVTSSQINHLSSQKPDLFHLLHRPQLIPEESFDFTEDWRKVGLKIMDKLMTLSDSFWFRKCAQTWRLEHKDELFGVDLETMRLKLSHHIYTDPQDVRRDIGVICSNCQKRLGVDHEISRSARAMSNQFFTLADQEGYNDLIRKFKTLK